MSATVRTKWSSERMRIQTSPGRPSDLLLASCRRRITGVRCAGGLDQQNVCLLLRPRTVLYAPRNYEELALSQLDIAIPKLDREPPLQDQKEVVGVVVGMPNELALRLDDGNLVVVHLADGFRAEVLLEGRQLLGQVDLVVHHPPSFARIAGRSGSARCI